MLTVACPSATPYPARRADQTSLYGVVVDHLERFVGLYDERYAARYGDWRPEVERALRQFLQCGILAYGFMRVACKACRAEYLVAYSCKGRGLCPSCGQRRSLEFAASTIRWAGGEMDDSQGATSRKFGEHFIREVCRIAQHADLFCHWLLTSPSAGVHPGDH